MAAKPNYVVQAYRRKGDSFNDIILGLHVKFAPNEKGHVVATIPAEREDVYSRLVDQIPEAYVAYEGNDAIVEQTKVLTAKDTEPPVPPANLYVLRTTGDDGKLIEIDLKPMSDAEIRKFAKENSITVEGDISKLKGDKLRAAIAKAVGQGDNIPDDAGAVKTPEEQALIDAANSK